MVRAFLQDVLDRGGGTRVLAADEMIALAKSVDLDALELGEYRCFRPDCYSRNRVLQNEHFELVVLCWGPRHKSSIHDHGISNCLYLVLEGEMEEELYEAAEGGGEPVKTKTACYARGELTLAGGEIVHRISNNSDDQLVTLHIYSPPLDKRVTHYTPIPHHA